MMLFTACCSSEGSDRSREVEEPARKKTETAEVETDMSSGSANLATPEARLNAAARAQAGMPDAEVSELRPIYEDRVPDLWALNVRGDRGRVIAVLHRRDGRVTVPSGLAQAGRSLAAWKVLAAPDWKGSLIYVVAASGASTPGWPDYPEPEESALEGGGIRVTLSMPASWVRYAAAGGVGTPPPKGSGEGLAEPEEQGTAVLDVGADYALAWHYHIGGKELARFEAKPAQAPPALEDEALLKILETARRRARAPRAMPLTEPGRLDERYPDIYAVELYALGAVYVDLTSPAAATDLERAATRLEALGVDLGAPPVPEILLPLLEATGGLPPGLLASDLLASVRRESGQLIAEVPGPLLHWASEGAREPTPRSPRWSARTHPDWKPRGRARLQLSGGAIAWTLETGDGADYDELPSKW